MVKRIADITLSLIIGILLLPFCIIIAVIIRLHDGGSIFYSGERIGAGGKRFNMLKFRTMRENSYIINSQKGEFQQNFKIKYDNRITKTGHFLRRHCLDEIPQLINVLKGEMSIIGPRPKLPEEVGLYGENRNELLSVLPGITGYWQVYRKDASSDENMRTMDLYYIRNRTIIMDIKLFLLTFFVIFSRNNY